ncbi:hypothetical protein DdX_13628 [Ditylenchus destructor]|uniref:Uncharacterized protein n=1 Tax=Ditylenchus destructor TaxID=166010 RepID=A0AAD4MYF7_9BILA|nr:hypothetical protein DdX_13628 [Ditylenchus destructor]
MCTSARMCQTKYQSKCLRVEMTGGGVDSCLARLWDPFFKPILWDFPAESPIQGSKLATNSIVLVIKVHIIGHKITRQFI